MTNSIRLCLLGAVYPPQNTPRVLLDVADPTLYNPVKSPKSVASPVDAIVIKSIIFVFAGVGYPPPTVSYTHLTLPTKRIV